MKRNGKIELMRFLFSMAVMIFHSYYFAPDYAHKLFMRGALGVEFFFVVSGYLMACSVAKKAHEPCADLGKETSAFVWRKITSLMPNFIVAWVLGLFVMYYRAGDFSLKAFLQRASEGIWELLFLVMAGFGKVRVNVDWYISAMLLAMLILYPICRKFFSVFSRIIAPVVACFILGFFYYTSFTPTDVMRYYDFVYKGMLRAVAEICLGVACYPVIDRIRRLKFTSAGKKIITIVESSAWLLAFIYMAIYQTKKYDFLAMLLIVLGTVLAFSHQGYFADWFDKAFFGKLGEFSLSLYLGHSYWSHLFASKLSHVEYASLLLPYITVSLLSGLAVFCISKWIRKGMPAVIGYCKRKLIVE